MKVTCRPKFLDLFFRFSTHVCFSSPKSYIWITELRYKHVAMKFAFFWRTQNPEVRFWFPDIARQPFPKRGSRQLSMLFVFTLAVLAGSNRQLTPVPPCRLSAAPWPFGLHWHPFRNLWVPKVQLLLKYREWKNLGGWGMRSNTEKVSSRKNRYSKDIPLLVLDLSHPYNRSSLRR